MLEVAEALAEVLRHARPLAAGRRPRSRPAVLGRVLAEDVRADADSPPFDKSLRDGYAVRAADCASPNAELRVVAEIAAGAVPTRADRSRRVRPHLHRRPDPDGADAVVMQEDTHAARRRPRADHGRERASRRQWVFAAAPRCGPATWCCPPGRSSTPRRSGCSASVGLTRARPVSRGRGWPCSRPATNSSSRANRSGRARSATRTGRCSRPRSCGPAACPRHLGIVRDDPSATRSAIDSALADGECRW